VEPCAVAPPAEELWPEDSDPGVPPEEEAPLGSELEAEAPLELEVCGADPGDWLGEPLLVLCVLPEPLDEDDEEEDEEEEEEDGEPDDDDEPLEEGMPPEELLLLEDVAQPAVTSRSPTPTTAAVRRSCAAWGLVIRCIAVAPSG
jgi:hypothetical protein